MCKWYYTKCTVLKHLQLQENALSGKCVGSILDLSKCTALQTLSLGGNELTGEIPWQMLHDLVQNHGLRKLALGENKFTVTTIPPIVATMTNLEALAIHELGFTGEIPDFSKCTALQKLLTSIQLISFVAGEVPKSLKALTQLSALSLYENQLKVSHQAPLNSYSDMHYNTRSKVEAFLAVL